MSAIFGPDCEADLEEAFFTHACSGYFVEVGANTVPLKGRLQFVRKHYVSLPFRHLREASRRLRHGTWLPRGKAGPVP